jgi:hypothetical protein
METLAELLARGRDREGPAFVAADRTAPHTYREFCTNAWKAGNLLRHYGVRRGSRLGVVVGPKEPGPDDEPGRLGTAVDPLLALCGGAVVGATVDLDPDPPVGARALVGPDAWLDGCEAEPGCSRLAYGGPPADADVAHFERELWSENPVEPPGEVAPDDPVLAVRGGAACTHGELCDLAAGVVGEYGLGPDEVVGLDAPLTDAGAVAAGVVAPLSVGATVRIGDSAADGPDAAGELAYVVSSDRDDSRALNPDAVTG